MEALLGFSLDFWDYATFLSLSFLVAVGLGFVVFLLGLPGRIAIARNHPEAEAVYLMGWIGFLAVVPWIQALVWADKATTVIDVRYLPEERRTETEATIAKLTGDSPAAITAPQRSKESQRHDGCSSRSCICVACVLACFFSIQAHQA